MSTDTPAGAAKRVLPEPPEVRPPRDPEAPCAAPPDPGDGTGGGRSASLPANDPDFERGSESLAFLFGLDRRRFVQVLGGGLVLAVQTTVATAQNRGGRGGEGGRSRHIGTRIHLSTEGVFTVLTGKIEMGQGARAQLSQAAAEELRVPVSQVQMLMGDTRQVPDDGLTAGSRTTPQTMPAVRRAAAAARHLLLDLAAQRWAVERDTLDVRDGRIRHPASNQTLTYADLARSGETAEALNQVGPSDVQVTPVAEWKVLGTSVPRPNRRDLVTGAHRYPSDQTRPGLLYGRVLRPPSFGATLASVDLNPARAMPGVVAVQDGAFVGVAAPSLFLATQALNALATTARWEPAPHPSSIEVYDYLRQRAQGGVPSNPFAEELAAAHRVLRRTYRVPYVQHAPMETRAALAEWDEGRLTVWTGTQNPFGYHHELARTFRLAHDQVRVIVPDFGGGFGGKHTGEAAIEAARLAQAAGKPVLVRWTREEEFTWAYFRPAAVIEVEASLNAQGTLTSWHFVNINSGGAAVDTPYRTGQARSRFVPSASPLRQGSYRTLAATANNFARECFMDELAAAAGKDPLDFRLAHLENPRLRAVLEAAAQRFHWRERVKHKQPDQGVGLACGTEKGSYVAACAEVRVERTQNALTVLHVGEVFECGAVVNPSNLLAQVQGCILMGLGPALREEMRFANGRIRNPSFAQYLVPRFEDVPELDIHLLDRPDLPSVGAGETPIIAIAPALANAVAHATGQRIHALPIRPGGV